MLREVDQILTDACEKRASDVHFTVGLPPLYRIDGQWDSSGDDVLTVKTSADIAGALLGKERFEEFQTARECDSSYGVAGVGRFRVNAFFQRGSVGVAVRCLPFQIPTFEGLGLPAQTLQNLCSLRNGLVLVCGATGMGKSTTLASMIGHINSTSKWHIVTIEDPIEFVHKHGQSIIDQREVGVDTSSFGEAMRRVLRQSPDVVLVGEIRDPETVRIALTIAETGHLVLSTVHTGDVTQGLSRLVDMFPEAARSEIRVSLSLTLRAMIVQQLLHSDKGKGRILAYEVMLANPAVRNLIREGKFEQVYNQMHSRQETGMCTMNVSLCRLWRDGEISAAAALAKSPEPAELRTLMEHANRGAI